MVTQSTYPLNDYRVFIYVCRKIGGKTHNSFTTFGLRLSRIKAIKMLWAWQSLRCRCVVVQLWWSGVKGSRVMGLRGHRAGGWVLQVFCRCCEFEINITKRFSRCVYLTDACFALASPQNHIYLFSIYYFFIYLLISTRHADQRKQN